nr:hypothetical protein [Tanacetum cinerariifolium]
MSYLSDFEGLNGGYVSFGGNPKGGKISRKVKIKTGKLDFDDVYFVKELKFNLFSVSQMCDKKNNVLFTDTECLVLSLEFKLPDENHPWSFRRVMSLELGIRSLPPEWNTHVVVWRNKSDLDTISIDDLYNNFKIIKQEVKGTANSNSSSQNMAFVSSPGTNITNKVHTTYGVSTANTQSSTTSTQVHTTSTQTSTANLSDATVYAFLANQSNGSQLVHEDLKQIHKDDLEEMDLKWQIALLSMREKRFFQKIRRKITINGGDTAGFDKSKVKCYNYHKMGHFARECRQPRNQDSRNWNQDSSRRTVNVEETPPKAMVSIDGVGSQITDNIKKGLGYESYHAVSPPPTGLFSPPKLDLSNSGLEKFQQPEFEGCGPKTSKNGISNKTPYELFRGRTPGLSFMRPSGCHVTILNTLDHLGEFDRKFDDGFFVGYSLHNKAFRVYTLRTRKVEENLHIKFLKDKPSIACNGPKWLFYIDVLTESMNYVPVVAGTNSNDFVGTEESIGEGHSNKEKGSSQDYTLMSLGKDSSLFDSSLKNARNDEPKPSSDVGHKDDEGKESKVDNQEKSENSTQDVNTVGLSINTASANDNAEVDLSNILTTYQVPTTPNTIIHKDHSLDHVIGDVQSEPTRVAKALFDPASVEAMQKELLQFKLQKVWILVDSPKGKKAIGLQVKQKEDGLFISQDKYVTEVLRKFNFSDVKSASPPVNIEKPLVKDVDGDDVDVHLYRSMIGSLMYLTTSRPDIMYVVCKPTASEGFEQIIDFLNANPIKYALTVNLTIYSSCIKQFWATTKVQTVNGEEKIQSLVDKKKVIITKTCVRSELHLDDAKDEHVTTTSSDPLLSGEDRLKLTELMDLCTQLQSRVLDLETTKANQALEIRSLKRREDVSKQERMIADLDADERVALVDETQERNDQDMFNTFTTAGVEVSTVAITSQISIDEITLSKALIDIKTSKPKAKGIVMQELSERPKPTPIDSSQQSSKAKLR